MHEFGTNKEQKSMGNWLIQLYLKITAVNFQVHVNLLYHIILLNRTLDEVLASVMFFETIQTGICRVLARLSAIMLHYSC